MNAISQALIQLAKVLNSPDAGHQLPPDELAMADAFAALMNKERQKFEESGAVDPAFCTICDATGVRHMCFDDDDYTEEDFTEEELNGAAWPSEDFHREWRQDLEASGHVPRDIVAGYVNDVTEAAILNAATLARIGRKWGLEED